MAYSPTIFEKITVNNIDGLTNLTAVTFTPKSSFIVTDVKYRARTLTGVVGMNSVSIGTNSSSYDNIQTSLALTALSSLSIVVDLGILATNVIVPAGTSIYHRVSAGIGTAIAFDIDLLGYYI